MKPKIYDKLTAVSIIDLDPPHWTAYLAKHCKRKPIRQIYVARGSILSVVVNVDAMDVPESIMVRFHEDVAKPVIVCHLLTRNVYEKIFQACVAAETSGKVSADDLRVMGERWRVIDQAVATVDLWWEVENEQC